MSRHGALENASFSRIQNISLTRKLPKKMVAEKISFRQLKSMTAETRYTFTDYIGNPM